MLRRREQDRGARWIQVAGECRCGQLWWRVHVQGMQVLVDSCPYPGVRRLLVHLKMVDEVQKNAFEAVPFKAFPH